MTIETKKRLCDAVDLVNPKNKGSLYLLIKNYMEREQSLDTFFDQQPKIKVHKAVENSCVACES